MPLSHSMTPHLRGTPRERQSLVPSLPPAAGKSPQGESISAAEARGQAAPLQVIAAANLSGQRWPEHGLNRVMMLWDKN